MPLQFSDAQKHVLAYYRKLHLSEIDVRKWPVNDRMDFFFSDELSLFLMAHGVAKCSCAVPKYTLAIVSPTFAEHLLQDPDLHTFTFDVGRMDGPLQKEHDMALNTLNTWLVNLSTPAMTVLQALTFYPEIALRHIARQLGMISYLTDRTDKLIRDAQTHTL